MYRVLILFISLFCCCSFLHAQKAQWQIQNSGVETSIRGASAVDENICWLGTKGCVLRTVDGGKSWQKLTIAGADSLDFRDVAAFDKDTCIAMSAGPGTESRIYKTTDGGRNWKMVRENAHHKGFYNGMAFWDNRVGLLAGDPIAGVPYLLKTTDAGETWEEIPGENMPPLMEGEYGFAASGTHIATVGNQVAFIGTGGSTARIFHTTDQGKSWQVVNTPMISGEASQGIFSIAFSDEQFGMAVGGDYTKENEGKNNVMFTENGGKSWHLVNTVRLDYRSCIAMTPGVILVAGPSGTEISYDDGKSFKSISDQGFHTLAVSPDGKGIWAAGAVGVVGRLKMK